LRVALRITSRVGRIGAAASLAKPTPRISTPNRMAESDRVAPRRSPGPITGGMAGVLAGAVAGVAAASPVMGSGPAPAGPAGLDGLEQGAGDVQAALDRKSVGEGKSG